jgi:hypothetical protein
MERKMYQMTERQMKKIRNETLPSDEYFKTEWARKHHGKTTGWGMSKRDYIVCMMSGTHEYQLGLWQGRVDRAREVDYAEERLDAPYNLGYYRGYTDYESNRRGWDAETKMRFDAEYVNS